MKKQLLLLLLVINFMCVFAQETNDNCERIPMGLNAQGTSSSHGTPTWQEEGAALWDLDDNSFGLWANNNWSEGRNFTTYNFEKDKTYQISFTYETLSRTDGSAQGFNNPPINQPTFLHLYLTEAAVRSNNSSFTRPNIPVNNQRIMSENFWTTRPSVEGDHTIVEFTANRNFTNMWFFTQKDMSGNQAIVFISNIEVCYIECEDNEGVDFHFEDDNKLDSEVFNLCEDVFVDANATVDASNYSVELSKVNTDNSTTVLAEKNTVLKRFNVTEMFVNAVTFEENTTYEVKLTTENPRCKKLVYETKRFTYSNANIRADFDMIYDCKDGTFDVTVLPLSNEVDASHSWKLYETSVAGSILDSDTVGLIKGVYGDTSHQYTNLDPKKHYYIAHTVTTTNCEKEVRTVLTHNCCPEEPQIFPYCDDPCVLDSFPLKVKGENGTILTALDGYTFEWLNTNTGETSTNDIVTATEADIWVLTITEPIYHCEYTLQYSLSCCDEDLNLTAYECPSEQDINALQAQLNKLNTSNPNTTYQKDLEYSNILAKNVKTKANCNPCDVGLFIIRLEDETGKLITDFNSITWNDGLYTNQNIRWGYVDTEYKATINKTNANGSDTCTYEKVIIYKCEDKEECSDLPAPTNLRNNDDFLLWDPVPGATSYIVSPASQDVSCCDDTLEVFPEITTSLSSVRIPDNLKNRCFTWEVKVVCSDRSVSAISEPMCYEGLDECSTLSAPTNLAYTIAYLNWDPVPGAVKYVVSAPNPMTFSCCNSEETFTAREAFTNQLSVPFHLRSSCFSWQVTAICSDGSVSPASEAICYVGIIDIENPKWDLMLRNEEPMSVKEDISVFPNPNRGLMSIQLDTKLGDKISLEIYNLLDGKLVKTIEKINNSNGQRGMINLQPNIAKGVYLFHFNTNEGIIIKRVIIE